MLISPEMAYDRLKTAWDLSEQERIELAKVACQDSRFAYLTYCIVERLPADIRQLAMKKACESPRWAFCLRFKPEFAEEMNEETKRLTELKACEDPEIAYHLRYLVSDVPDEIKRKAELRICDHPKWSLLLRTRIDDVPEEIRRRAELRAWMSETTREALRLTVQPHPDTQKLDDLIQMGMDPETAFQIVAGE